MIGNLSNSKRLKSAPGQNMAEYALLLILVTLVCIAALQSLGGTLNGFFTNASNQIQTSSG